MMGKRLAEIKLLVQYAVPPEDISRAVGLVEKHGSDLIALNLFHAFYSFLPEGREDAIRIIRQLDRRQGTFLLCATTGLDDYLYLVSAEQAEFLGPFAQGIWEEEVLAFFGYQNREVFLRKNQKLDAFPVYVPAQLQPDLCPVCHAADGEFHTLGCPVEICPWCGGQLTSCACRFNRFGKSGPQNEGQLENLLGLLNKKGRIPFCAEEHRPSYPVTPLDLDQTPTSDS